MGEGVELGEGGAALGPQRLRPVQHLRNPPLLRQRRQGDFADRLTMSVSVSVAAVVIAINGLLRDRADLAVLTRIVVQIGRDARLAEMRTRTIASSMQTDRSLARELRAPTESQFADR